MSWFPHDSSAGMDQHILMLRGEFGNRGYGMFWLVLEAMYETSDGTLDAAALPGLCIRMAEDRETVQRFFDYCISIGLFIKKGGKIYSERLLEEKAKHLLKSEEQRKRAESRWKKEKAKKSNATAVPRQSRGNAPTHPPDPPTKQATLPSVKGPRPSVEKVMAAMTTCFGNLDRSEKENRRYAWLLIQRAAKGPPVVEESRAADLCCMLIMAAKKSEWWSEHITCVADVYRNARKIAASLRDQEKAHAVFIS